MALSFYMDLMALRKEMTLQRLVEFFSYFTRLPVTLTDIRKQVVEQLALADKEIEIIFSPMNISPEILLGMTLEYVDDQGRRYFTVFYNAHVSVAEQRLICCKEIVHLYDDGETVTRTAEDLNELITEVVEIPLRENSPLQGMHDKVAVFYALAVLFPEDVREEYIDLLEKQKVDLRHLAKIFSIPEQYMSFLVSKGWVSLRRYLIL